MGTLVKKIEAGRRYAVVSQAGERHEGVAERKPDENGEAVFGIDGWNIYEDTTVPGMSRRWWVEEVEDAKPDSFRGVEDAKPDALDRIATALERIAVALEAGR